MIWRFAILFTDYTTACLRYKCGSGTEFGLLEVYGSGDYKTSCTRQTLNQIMGALEKSIEIICHEAMIT